MAAVADFAKAQFWDFWKDVSYFFTKSTQNVVKTNVTISDDRTDLLKLSDFTLYKAKDNGISSGGFYHDKNNQKWLLKDGHYYKPEAVVKEYIAGGIYQLILGHCAPTTEIVLNTKYNDLMIGSKLLDNFATLSNFSNHTYYEPYGKNFPTSINNKPIDGFMDAMWAINFVKDTDAHSENVGLINQGDHYDFAKIDHGFSFNYYGEETTLDSILTHLNLYYDIDSLEKIGFEEVYQGLTHITNLDFSNIEGLVKEKMTVVKTNMEALHLTDLFCDYNSQPANGSLQNSLDKYENTLLSNLKAEHQQFQKIADFMLLEKSIIDHDSASLSNLLNKGVSLQEGFKAFCQDSVAAKMPWWEIVCSPKVTGMDLGFKHWPEMFNAQTLNDLLNNNLPNTTSAVNNTASATVGIDAATMPFIIQPLEVAPIHVECI